MIQNCNRCPRFCFWLPLDPALALSARCIWSNASPTHRVTSITISFDTYYMNAVKNALIYFPSNRCHLSALRVDCTITQPPVSQHLQSWKLHPTHCAFGLLPPQLVRRSPCHRLWGQLMEWWWNSRVSATGTAQTIHHIPSIYVLILCVLLVKSATFHLAGLLLMANACQMFLLKP